MADCDVFTSEVDVQMVREPSLSGVLTQLAHSTWARLCQG